MGLGPPCQGCRFFNLLAKGRGELEMGAEGVGGGCRSRPLGHRRCAALRLPPRRCPPHGGRVVRVASPGRNQTVTPEAELRWHVMHLHGVELRGTFGSRRLDTHVWGGKRERRPAGTVSAPTQADTLAHPEVHSVCMPYAVRRTPSVYFRILCTRGHVTLPRSVTKCCYTS